MNNRRPLFRRAYRGGDGKIILILIWITNGMYAEKSRDLINISRDVEVADCRWQSFCDLTESADESPPLQPNGIYVNNCRGRRPRRPKNANEYR